MVELQPARPDKPPGLAPPSRPGERVSQYATRRPPLTSLLPVPLVEVEPPPATSLSRGTRQRVSARRYEAREVNRTLEAVNWRAGVSGCLAPSQPNAELPTACTPVRAGVPARRFFMHS